MANFISGIQLSKRFYENVVKDIFEEGFPDVGYSIGLLGHGSEVLSYDTEISTDHDWGPRLILFLDELDYRKRNKIDNLFNKKLPDKFMGYSVSPDKVSDTREKETQNISTKHRIEITTIKTFFEKELGFNPNEEPRPVDWLLLSSQRLLSVTSGKVYYDGLGELNKIRGKFSYYPKDVWFYILASQWRKISQEDSFMGRAGDVGDDLGSRIIATRLVVYIMELCFIMEKRHVPFIKWLGTAFSELKCSNALLPILGQVLSANNWKDREKGLSKAYEYIAAKHNELGITNPLPAKVSKFYSRPYLVIQAGVFEKAIRRKIADKEVSALLSKAGSINQFIDNTDILDNINTLGKLKSVYLKALGAIDKEE